MIISYQLKTFYSCVMKVILSLLCFIFFSTSAMGQWEQYFAKYDGATGSVLVDMSYAETAPVKGYEYVLTTGIEFKPCSEDGMPDSITYEGLSLMSDKLEQYLSIQLSSTLVGTFTHQCKRVDFYYVKDTIGLRAFLVNFYDKNSQGYRAISSMHHDPEWTTYFDFLYPDMYIIEYMMNSKIIRELFNQGDQLKKIRRIDHWAYFSEEPARDKFRLLVLERGFKVESMGKHRGEQMPYFIHFSRRDKPDIDYMTELTQILQSKANELGGAYDGWESEIVKQ